MRDQRGSLSEFKSITAVASNDVCAVGHSQETTNLYFLRTLVKPRDSPNPSDRNKYYGTITNKLYKIATFSAIYVWAVGAYGSLIA